MKIAILLLCLAPTALAQNKTRMGQTNPQSAYTAACGPEATSFKVRRDNSQHGPLQPKPEMAEVYFIHDAGLPGTLGYPTTKYGLDGSWVGADHGNSWFAISVAPGEHHLCAALQTLLLQQRVELSHFTIEAGKSYYFRTRLVLSKAVELLELDRIDSDQGKYLVASFPMAISKVKK